MVKVRSARTVFEGGAGAAANECAECEKDEAAEMADHDCLLGTSSCLSCLAARVAAGVSGKSCTVRFQGVLCERNRRAPGRVARRAGEPGRRGSRSSWRLTRNASVVLGRALRTSVRLQEGRRLRSCRVASNFGSRNSNDCGVRIRAGACLRSMKIGEQIKRRSKR